MLHKGVVETCPKSVKHSLDLKRRSKSYKDGTSHTVQRSATFRLSWVVNSTSCLTGIRYLMYNLLIWSPSLPQGSILNIPYIV